MCTPVSNSMSLIPIPTKMAESQDPPSVFHTVPRLKTKKVPMEVMNVKGFKRTVMVELSDERDAPKAFEFALAQQKTPADLAILEDDILLSARTTAYTTPPTMTKEGLIRCAYLKNLEFVIKFPNEHVISDRIDMGGAYEGGFPLNE